MRSGCVLIKSRPHEQRGGQCPLADGLKALDPNRPIREADIDGAGRNVRVSAMSALASSADLNRNRRAYRRHTVASQGCLSRGRPAGR